MKVFISNLIPKIGIEMLEKEGYIVDIWKGDQPISEDNLIKKCKQADGYISTMGTIDKNFLNACSNLKVISTFSVGYDNIDIKTATKLGIPIGNTPKVLSNATADVAFLLMLNSARKVFFNYARILKGEWVGIFNPIAYLGQELNGKTLGIFGLGRIGFKMAQKCKGAYDMNIIYCNRKRNEEADIKLNATFVSFNELLAKSDIISLHAPLTPETKGIFNQEAFSKMKSTAILINTARGQLVNETDLLHAIKNKIIWGAGLDVTDPEPMHANNPLLFEENVAVTPHMGSSTIDARNAMSKLCAENIIAGLKSEKLPYIINPEVYNKSNIK